MRKQKKQIELEDNHPDPLPGPEQIAEDRDELKRAQKILQTLSEIDRTAFALRAQHDLPYLEIARVLQISEVAAKVKIHRARKKILAARMSKETL